MRAVDINLSTMINNDLLNDTHPQAQATGFGTFNIAPIESIEDMLDLMQRHALPLVYD